LHQDIRQSRIEEVLDWLAEWNHMAAIARAVGDMEKVHIDFGT